MQVLVPTATLTARKYGFDRTITADSLLEPRLNIQLGTAYLRDQIDKFGRIEYVAAAYNAGPQRATAWRTSLPQEIDEWAEAVPFKETRGYVQGVVRNRLQYERLYDMDGKFRANVGVHAVTAQPGASPAVDSTVVKRRVSGTDNEE
jgi:soluble lytic murein transglycosylase